MNKSILEKVREKNILFGGMIELTHRCNLSCRHCYIPSDGLREELSTSQFRNVLGQVAEAGALFMTFSGGEVFLREDFFEIATYAKKKNFAINILSNGTLIGERTAVRIKRLHPFNVEISIYGPDGGVHDRITGVPGSFDKAIRAIFFLKGNQVNVKIKTPLMKQNFDCYKDIVSLADKLKVKFEFSTIISPKLDGSNGPLSSRIGEREFFKVFSDPFLSPEITDLNREESHRQYQNGPYICGAGKTTCTIAPNGDVFPCVILRVPMGNLQKQTFSEIRDSFESEKMKCMAAQDLAACNDCKLSAYCDRCPGIALLEEGDLYGPAKFYCTMAEIRHFAYTGTFIKHQFMGGT